MDAVILKDVAFAYDHGQPIVQKISLGITTGERVGIIGPNGAGKTTLFMQLCGILKTKTGTLLIHGTQVRHNQFNGDLGYVFQNPDNQLFSPTVYDDVAFGLVNCNVALAKIENIVQKTLAECHVDGVMHRPSHHLSGGEKRMVAIASVMAMQPRLVIYDEPTASLDMRARRDVINLIMRDNERTSLIASHDLEFIREVCTRVVVMVQGMVIADGAPDMLLSNPVLMEQAGQEVPYSLRQ